MNLLKFTNIDYIKIFPDTKKTLQQLASYKKAIITNTPTDCTKQILRKLHIKRYFQEIVTSDDVKKAKPDPEIVIKACERLNVKPETAILVGDTQNDVKAGRIAGCTVIGINIPSDITIHRLYDLTILLK